MAFITDPKAVTLPDNEKLGALYGMTATQAKVSAKLRAARAISPWRGG